jgi:transcriptional regulator with XRE-family HTH domain
VHLCKGVHVRDPDLTYVPLNVAGVQALARALGIDSTSDLARRSGIERTYLGRILSGERPAQPSHVRAIAAALKVAPIALLGNDDPALVEALDQAEAAS